MGKGLKRLEDELGVIIRFVVGYRCATSGTRKNVPGQLAMCGPEPVGYIDLRWTWHVTPIMLGASKKGNSNSSMIK